MILPRFSPAILSAALAAFFLLGSSDTQAGASNKNGNPFGNGTFFPSGGTYSGIIRGSNGFLGNVLFTTSSTNSSPTNSSNSGVATIYYDGQQNQGSAYGVVDPSSGYISATYSAGSPLTIVDSLYSTTNTITASTNPAFNVPITNITSTNFQSNTVTFSTNPVFTFNTNGTIQSSNNVVTAFTNTQTIFINVTNVVYTNGVTYSTNQNNVVTYTTNTYSNTINGQFTAALIPKYPIQSFSGTGQASCNIYYLTNVASGVPGLNVSYLQIKTDVVSNAVSGTTVNN